jgi:hypothetical protein
MDERPHLPNYDPGFCLSVTKWGAAICVGWLVCAVLVLTMVDPSNSSCPGWTIHANKNGEATSLWFFVGLFAAVPAMWLCYTVLKWERFSQRTYDRAAGIYYGPWQNTVPKKLLDRYRPDPATFPYNRMHVAVIVCWSLFCTIPLWVMLTYCTSLPRYLGY